MFEVSIFREACHHIEAKMITEHAQHKNMVGRVVVIMLVSIIEIVKSFDLGFDLPVFMEELPEVSSEESAKAIAEHFIFIRLYQLRSLVVKEMSSAGSQDKMVTKIVAILKKNPSDRSSAENAFLSRTYEKVKGHIREFSMMSMQMYCDTKYEDDWVVVDSELHHILQGRIARATYTNGISWLTGFLGYCSCVQKDRASVERERASSLNSRVDYYTDMIGHVKRISEKCAVPYHQDDTRKEEQRIIKEYVDRYIPGPIMPVSMIMIVESFQLHFPLPFPVKELSETATEESATILARGYIITRLHQLRSYIVSKMIDACEEDEYIKNVTLIAKKKPSERTEAESAFIAQTYEKVKEYTREFATFYVEKYYGSKHVFESYEIENELGEIFGVKEALSPYDVHYIGPFMRYCMCIEKDLPSGKEERENGATVMVSGKVLTLNTAIDYYTNMINHIHALEIKSSSGDNTANTSSLKNRGVPYCRDASRLDERRIIKEYIDQYIPGPLLYTGY